MPNDNNNIELSGKNEHCIRVRYRCNVSLLQAACERAGERESKGFKSNIRHDFRRPLLLLLALRALGQSLNCYNSYDHAIIHTSLSRALSSRVFASITARFPSVNNTRFWCNSLIPAATQSPICSSTYFTTRLCSARLAVRTL